MTTLDKLVTNDLAALATESRLQLVPLGRSLRSLEPRDSAVDARPANRVVVVAARVYAQRLARTTASAVCLAGVIWGVYELIHPFGAARKAIGIVLHGNTAVFDGTGAMTFFLQPALLAVVAAVVALATYVVTLRLASHLFEWQLARAVERSIANELDDTGKGFATRLLERSQRLGLTVEVGAIASLIMLVGIAGFTVGGHTWTVFAFPPLSYDALDPIQYAGPLYMLLAITLAIVGGAVTGAIASRPVRRDYSGRLIAIGICALLVTMFVGFRFDVGPLVIERAWEGDFMYSEPVSVPLRIALVILGSASVTLVVGAVMWRRRRTEMAALAGDDRALGKGDNVVISLAHMFERRVANAAFGATCLLCIVVIVALNQEFDGGFNAEYRFTEALLQQDPLIMIALVILSALCVQLVAKRRARRALERHVQHASAIMDARQLVARADRWAVIFGLGGLATAITVFGVYASATETDPLLFLDRHWQIPWTPDQTAVIAAISIAIVMSAAALIGTRLRRPVRQLAFLERPTSAFIGIGVGVVAMYIGTYYRKADVDPRFVVEQVVRIGFTIVGALAVVIVVFGFALARRRRELDALRPEHRAD